MSTREEIKANLSKFLYVQWRKLEDGKYRKYSETAFARYSGVPQGNMSKYLSKDILPGPKNTEKLVKVYGPVIYDIMEVPHTIPNDDERAKQMNTAYRLLDEERRQILSDTVDKLLDDQITGKPVEPLDIAQAVTNS